MTQTIKILIALNAAVLIALLLHFRAEGLERGQAKARAFAAEGRLFEKDGVLDPGDFTRLMAIKDEAHRSQGGVSDSDLDWTISAMRRTHRNDKSSMALAARGTIALIWSGFKRPTPGQSRKLVAAIREQLDDPKTKDDDPVVSNGLKTLSRLKDPSALPTIRRFESSADRNTRRWAHTALKALGESSFLQPSGVNS